MGISLERFSGSKYIVKADSGTKELKYRIINFSRPTPSDCLTAQKNNDMFVFDSRDGEIIEVFDASDGSREIFAPPTNGDSKYIIDVIVKKKGTNKWLIKFDTKCNFTIDGSHVVIVFDSREYRFCGSINDKTFVVGREPYPGSIKLDEYVKKVMMLEY